MGLLRKGSPFDILLPSQHPQHRLMDQPFAGEHRRWLGEDVAAAVGAADAAAGPTPENAPVTMQVSARISV